MNYNYLIKCFLLIILTVLACISCEPPMLREIGFLSSLSSDIQNSSILKEAFNGVLDRRFDKIAEFKKQTNLKPEEMVFLDFVHQSLEFIKFLSNSSQREEFPVSDSLVKSYNDIVGDFHDVFAYKEGPTTDYDSLEEILASEEYYPKSKMMTLMDDYKSDFKLLVDYKLVFTIFTPFIDALETLKCQISSVPENDPGKAHEKTFGNAWDRFDLIVKMSRRRFKNPFEKRIGKSESRNLENDCVEYKVERLRAQL